MKKRLKTIKNRESELIKSLELKVSKLDNELRNLRLAYTLNHSQTESFFMFIYEFNFSEKERKSIERTLLFECKTVNNRAELIEKLKDALSPTHQLVMEEMMISLRNSNMYPYLTSLYFGVDK